MLSPYGPPAPPGAQHHHRWDVLDPTALPRPDLGDPATPPAPVVWRVSDALPTRALRRAARLLQHLVREEATAVPRALALRGKKVGRQVVVVDSATTFGLFDERGAGEVDMRELSEALDKLEVGADLSEEVRRGACEEGQGPRGAGR